MDDMNALVVQMPNRPTPEGRLLGKELARLADKAETEMRKKFPNQKERCQSCAFRAGTVPNGCPETLMDALKCVMERKIFLCHQRKDAEGHCTDICMGWANSQAMIGDKAPIETPWQFSIAEGDTKELDLGQS